MSSDLWRGEFGNAYHARSPGDVGSNIEFFLRAHIDDYDIKSVIEFGAGTGANLKAIHGLLPRANLSAVEINHAACEKLEALDYVSIVIEGSILQTPPDLKRDLAFTKGVCVHVPPEDLPATYDVIYNAATRYILLAEYYSPRLEMVPYRGHENALWKGPYAEQMLDRYSDLKCIDYGFVWARDQHPQDNLHWFLLSKGE